MTKGEMFALVVQEIGIDAASDYLSATNSCSHTDARYSGAPPGASCGVCFGCLVRRAAFAAAGVPDRTDYLCNDTTGRFTAFVQQKSIVEPMRDFVMRGIDRATSWPCHSRQATPPPTYSPCVRGARPSCGASSHDSHAATPRSARTHRARNRTRQLEQLGAVVFAATRSADEFERTPPGPTRVTIWGLGATQAWQSAQTEFDAERFAELISGHPVPQ